MQRVDKQNLVSVLENAAKNTEELKSCKAALLIGSQAAYLLSQDQRKPRESTDWDFIASASFLLSWLKGSTRLADIQMKMTNNESSAQNSQEKKEKHSVISNFFSKLSFKSDQTSNSNNETAVSFLSIQLTIFPSEISSYRVRYILDMEVPLSMDSSSAQLLLYEKSNNKSDAIPFKYDEKFQMKIATLETLLGLKKFTYHPSKWLRHTEDYHSLATLNKSHPIFSKKMLDIMETRIKEASTINNIAPKSVANFSAKDILQEDDELLDLVKKYNQGYFQISQDQVKTVTEDQIQFVAQLILIYTRQNKLFSPLASLEIIATSKSPSRWWSDLLRDEFPRLHQVFLSTLPTLNPPKQQLSTSLPSTWIFPQLPLDLALVIASKLNIQSFYEVSKLCAVSKTWQGFFSNDLVWKTIFQRTWKAQSVENLSWMSNFIIRQNLLHRVDNLDQLNSFVELTAKFQQTTVNDLLSLWRDLLPVSQPSVNSLRMYLKNIHKLQWMIQHTFIFHTTDEPAQYEDSPSKLTMQFFIGCQELPQLSQEYTLTHRYGDRGTSRYSLQAHELQLASSSNLIIRKFDGPELYGLYYGGWGLEGEVRETGILSWNESVVFQLPEGIITAFCIQIAECQKHVKSYFMQEWRRSLSYY